MEGTAERRGLMRPDLQPIEFVETDRCVKADSEKPQDIPFYRDNPCIGALPPIWSAEEVTDRLLHLPR